MPELSSRTDLHPSNGQNTQNIQGQRNVTFGNIDGSTIYIVTNPDGNEDLSLTSKPIPKTVPSLLPYLPDRKQQEEQWLEAVQNYFNQTPSQPLICIVHGDESQSHDDFFRRLKNHSFPKYMIGYDPGKTSIKDYHLPCPSELEKLEIQLCKNLGDKVLNRRSASAEEINQFFCGYPDPIIIYTHLLTENWQKYGFDILEELLNFWQKWPDLALGTKLIICLSIQYQISRRGNIDRTGEKNDRSIFRRIFWFFYDYFRQTPRDRINQKINEQLEELSRTNFKRFDRLSGMVLPKLTGIGRDHVEDWVRNEAKTFVGEEKIGELLDEVRIMFTKLENEPFKEKTIPMSDLARQLKSFLEKLG